MGASSITKPLLRQALKKTGITNSLERLCFTSPARGEYTMILRMSIINLLENTPDTKKIEEWMEIIRNTNKFDKYLETKQ